MYVESRERSLIRKAVHAMTDIALDGLAAHEVDELDEGTIAFISAALRSVIDRKEDDNVTGRLGTFDLERLSEIRTGFEAATEPERIDVSGRIMLSDDEVLKLQAELTGLIEQRDRLSERIDTIIAAFVRSGEAKLREVRHIQTWYFDTERTHGIRGLVSVTNDLCKSPSGNAYVGTAEELVVFLRASGYTRLETNSEILRIAWKAQSDS